MPGLDALVTCCSRELTFSSSLTAKLSLTGTALGGLVGRLWGQVAIGVPVVISMRHDWLILASEPFLIDIVTEKPVYWGLMNAHKEKQRFILSAFSTFSLCKMFGWISLRSVTLIHMEV